MIPPITRRTDNPDRCYCRCCSMVFETVEEFDAHRLDITTAEVETCTDISLSDRF